MLNIQSKDAPEQLSTSATKSGCDTPRVLSNFSMKVNQDNIEKYDFIAARTSMVKVNLIEAIVHLIKVCLGSGVMIIHEGYRSCGIWTALGLNILIGFCITYCMYTLTSSAQKLYVRVCMPTLTYSDLLEASVKIGPWIQLREYSLYFRYTLDFILALSLFCSCCVYQIIIARSLKQLVEGSDVLVNGGNPPTKIYILILMLPCLLICMITSLKYLTPFIVVSDLFIISLAVTTTYLGATMSTTSIVNLPGFVSIPGLFQFLGLCLFSLDGFGAVMAIENHMAEPKKFPIVLLAVPTAAGIREGSAAVEWVYSLFTSIVLVNYPVSRIFYLVKTCMSFVIIAVIMNGFFGCWGFGDKGQLPITINYPWRPFPIMLKVFTVLMLYVTFALNFCIPFELIWYYMKLRHAPAQYWFWERIYRALFVIIITLVSYGLPNVTNFSGLIGSICVSNTGLVYPAFIELLVNWKEPGLGVLKWRLWKCIFFMTIGLLLCCGGTYVNGITLIEAVFYNDSTART